MNDEWGDLEADAQSNVSKKGPSCGMARMFEVVREEHGEDAVTSIARALANHRLTTSSIRRALESRVDPDFLPSQFTIQRHRNKVCTCRRSDDA